MFPHSQPQPSAHAPLSDGTIVSFQSLERFKDHHLFHDRDGELGVVGCYSAQLVGIAVGFLFIGLMMVGGALVDPGGVLAREPAVRAALAGIGLVPLGAGLFALVLPWTFRLRVDGGGVVVRNGIVRRWLVPSQIGEVVLKGDPRVPGAGHRRLRIQAVLRTEEVVELLQVDVPARLVQGPSTTRPWVVSGARRIARRLKTTFRDLGDA